MDRAAETLIQPLGITKISVYRADASLTWNYPLLPPLTHPPKAVPAGGAGLAEMEGAGSDGRRKEAEEEIR